MIGPGLIRTMAFWLLFIGLSGALLFFQVLPLHTAPRGITGPDFQLCLVFAWVQRRPEFLPPLLLAAVLFFSDLLLMRAPGLWTLLVLAGAEFLRSRHNPSTEMPFPAEWGLTSFVIVASIFLNATILNILGPSDHSVRLAFIQALMTVTAYPLVVVFCHYVLHLRRPAPGDFEARGPVR